MKSVCFWCTVLIITAAIFVSLSMVVPRAARADEEAAGTLDHTVSLEGKSGFSLFLAKLYNEHRLLYALVVTCTMALLGIAVAMVTDFILKLMGLRKARRAL
jgi:ABC-type phosphate/phosphonate transport system permease subunit